MKPASGGLSRPCVERPSKDSRGRSDNSGEILMSPAVMRHLAVVVPTSSGRARPIL